MDEGNHKSKREDLERKEDSKRDRDSERKESSKRSSDRERGAERKDDSKRSDRDRERGRDKERNGERHKDREKARDKDSEKKEREVRRSEREKSTDDKHREKYKETRHKEKERVREKEKEREEREREKEREKDEREKEKERARKEKEREREDREREREKLREREERAKEREREKEKERAREREKEREREEREWEREREKEKAREREKEREREEREREREREREKDRDRNRDREKRRELDRDDRDSEDGRDHERKRRRRDDDPRERDREREHKEDNKRKRLEEDIDTKERRREEDLEEEQRKLDEEMDKRRRRVQEWQELKRKNEEHEREKSGQSNTEELESGKIWSLDSDDEEPAQAAKSEKVLERDGDAKPAGENGDPMVMDSENGTSTPDASNEEGLENGEEEVDPLDAFMNSMVLPEVKKLTSADTSLVVDTTKSDPVKKDTKDSHVNGEQKKGTQKAMGRIIPGEDSDSDYGDHDNNDVPTEEEDDDEFMKRVKKTKVEKLSLVDHSKIHYPVFRKNFYIEVKEISRMSVEEVAAYRKQLELKLHGKDVPKPIKAWSQTGLTSKLLDIIRKLNYEKPMPIQAQALPIIMSGRDCIGVAKTGSGKTLAFVLPMLRHIKDQPPVVAGDGPIGLIMAPTRELVQQIHSDIKKFSKTMGINCVPVYGGSGVAQQISDLKRGTEIVVCTPGRMIDILCTSSGKITNLRRVTYLVMDEADRMFDMGFEPQITRIVQNTRPDRQTVLFSATFPRQVEILARKVLNKPVEIQVGGRSVVNKDITQLVEVRQENERFLRLLELLGEWYEKGKILVFVHSQEKCDSLFKELLKHGYPCLSLHGAKDQTDRESTISDFKANVCNLLIATSVAARGLDVKELELVVNFDVPNHYEDYVHRVGRTGRAGRKGCAITFISEEDSRYAPDLVKALELSDQAVPEDLKALADGFMAKVKQGTEQAHGTGYGGSGFKFNEEEDEARKAAKKAQAREYGFEEDKSDSDSDDDGVRKAGGDISQAAALAQAAAMAAVSRVAVTSMPAPVTGLQMLANGGLASMALPSVAGIPGPSTLPAASLPGDGAARAAALAAAMNLQHNLAKIHADAMPEHYEAELEINDFPQNARWKVTHKETLGPISDWTGAAITTRGQFFPPGKIPSPGERKLYLFIEGPTESSVKKAKAEVKRVLEDYTAQSLALPGAAQPGKYSVL